MQPSPQRAQPPDGTSQGDRGDEPVYILSGFQGKVAFALLVIMAAIGMYTIGDGRPSMPFLPDPVLVEELFILMPILGVFAFTHADEPGEFYLGAIVSMLVYGPLVAYLLVLHSSMLLAAAVGIFLFLALVFTWPKERDGLFLAVLHTVGILWVTSGLLTVAIKLHILPEHTLAIILVPVGINLRFVGSYVDMRVTLGAVFVAAIFIVSISRAIGEGPPKIPQISRPPKASPPATPPGLLGASLYPFLLTFDTGLLVGWFFVNLGWLIGATLFIYLILRIGKNVGHLLHLLILHSRLWTGSFRIAALYGLVFALCGGIKVILPILRRYLITISSFHSPYPAMTKDLAMLGVFGSLVCFGVIVHFIIFTSEDLVWLGGVMLRAAVHRQAFASATVAIGYFLAAVLIYILADIQFVMLAGFQEYGVVTLAMLALILLVALVYLILQIIRPQTAS